MSCLDNTDILRIVGGNSFQIAITVKARRVADGSEIEDFDLSASSPVLNLIHAGEKTQKHFVTQGNQAIISFDGSEGLGYYGMEMSGSYNSEAWRFCIEKVLQLVDTNAKANIPEWSVLVDDTYFIEGTISIYGGGGGGDTVQSDWTETNPTSAAFILHKPDLSVYATKTEVASGLAGKQDTIVDLSSIRYGAAAGATAYQKPSSGIPESDMSEGVQSALDKAEDAYQLPANGIPATDMDSEVQAALEKANSAVQTETDPVFSNSPAAEISQTDINNWNAKQPAIADLADIREGAAAGASAVQPDEMAQAIDEVDGDIDAINAKIPTAASSLNQLADKAYVNSSIATNSATYRGSFNLITDLGMNVDATHAQIAGALATAIVTADNNDYAFVQIPDSASTPTVIAKIERYKHNGSGWVYEYDLNNSGFTAAQWAAINSGITSGLVGKLADLPNNSELATLLNGKQNVISDLADIREGAAAGATAIQPSDLTEAINDVEDEIAGLDESKQDTIEDLSTIRSGAAAGATAYQKPVTGIPESDMSDGVQTSLGKADSAYQKPASGIPATDMSEGVQAALEKANSAVQTETDPVFSNSPAAEISQEDINTWNAKQPAIADLANIREGAAAGASAVQPDEMAQAIDEVDGDIADINAKIPTAASNLNQLADKAYVNSSIATNSATYRGSFNLITDLGMNVDATHAQIAGALATAIVTADNNDYAFVQIPDSASTPTVIAKIERYKHNGTGWVYEYDLNNSGFTAAQWAAINSGITSGLVGKLSDLPNNSELTTLLNGKQNTINDLSDIRDGAAAGATAYQKPSSGIPREDMNTNTQNSLNKADTAYQKPQSGIPATDLDSSTQTAIGKANSAIQTETDPVFSASPAAGIQASDITNWNSKQAALTFDNVPTANSNNPVKSGGVKSAMDTLEATVDARLDAQDDTIGQLDGHEVIPVADLDDVSNPDTQKVYRVAGTQSYSDYMCTDPNTTPPTWKKLAEYAIPVSAEYIVDNNLNKTQEEVNGTLKNKTDKIVTEDIEDEENEIVSVVSNDLQTTILEIRNDGVNAKNLKRNGVDVLTEHQDISGLATKSELANTIILLKNEIQEKQDVIEEISTEDVLSETKEQVWVSDDYNEDTNAGEVYAKIGENGVSAKNFYNLDGTPVIHDSLSGKLWAVLGDSFTFGATNNTLSDGKYKGKRKVYPYYIGNRTGINVIDTFFASGRTLAFPVNPGDFTNSICNPNASCYYQNIPANVDIITIYLGINDSHHAPGSGGGDGEDNTGEIPIGVISDSNTSTYYGAWNVVLSWLIENRPFAHIGIIVSNGCGSDTYRQAQIEIAHKYGIPFIDLNGDDRTPFMLRSTNPNISSAMKEKRIQVQAVNYPSNLHPNDDAHLFESWFIESFLRTI